MPTALEQGVPMALVCFPIVVSHSIPATGKWGALHSSSGSIGPAVPAATIVLFGKVFHMCIPNSLQCYWGFCQPTSSSRCCSCCGERHKYRTSCAFFMSLLATTILCTWPGHDQAKEPTSVTRATLSIRVLPPLGGPRWRPAF